MTSLPYHAIAVLYLPIVLRSCFIWPILWMFIIEDMAAFCTETRWPNQVAVMINRGHLWPKHKLSGTSRMISLPIMWLRYFNCLQTSCFLWPCYLLLGTNCPWSCDHGVLIGCLIWSCWRVIKNRTVYKWEATVRLLQDIFQSVFNRCLARVVV